MLMRRWGTCLAGLIFACGLCSCRTGVTSDGDACYELSKSEIQELVEIARYSLRRPGRQLTREEAQVIQKNDPEVQVIYSGDCCGMLRVRWVLPKKQASIVYRGLLNDQRKRSTVFEIVPNSDRTIYKGVPGHEDTKL